MKPIHTGMVQFVRFDGNESTIFLGSPCNEYPRGYCSYPEFNKDGIPVYSAPVDTAKLAISNKTIYRLFNSPPLIVEERGENYRMVQVTTYPWGYRIKEMPTFDDDAKEIKDKDGRMVTTKVIEWFEDQECKTVGAADIADRESHTIAALKDTISSQKDSIAELNKRLDTFSNTILKRDSEVSKAKSRIVELEKELAALKAKLKV